MKRRNRHSDNMAHYTKCLPNDNLAIGLRVQTQRGAATVVGRLNSKDQFGEPITVHKLRYANGAVYDLQLFLHLLLDE